jgi:hypothetical protein
MYRSWALPTGAVSDYVSMTVSSLTLGEPDAALFTVDASYEELPPSQAAQRHFSLTVPATALDNLVKSYSMRDPEYQSNRPPK